MHFRASKGRKQILFPTLPKTTFDFAEVYGHEGVKRFRIAAAGGHNVLLLGLPGS